MLADRVRSYFQKGHRPLPEDTVLVSQIADLDTMVTRSELEALILESNLVKRNGPGSTWSYATTNNIPTSPADQR